MGGDYKDRKNTLVEGESSSCQYTMWSIGPDQLTRRGESPSVRKITKFSQNSHGQKFPEYVSHKGK